MSRHSPTAAKPRVLVSGATGFIGQHCLKPLRERGFEVHGLSRQPAINGVTGITWHQTDLLHGREIEGLVSNVRATHLLHLAWITTPGAYWTSPENREWTASSLELVNAFLKYGGRRVTVAGTCAEYDWSQGWCEEGLTPLEPASPYGSAKLRLSVQLSELCRKYDAQLAWGRVFFPFGPGEGSTRLVASVCRDLLAGGTARCSLGFQVRDFLYVEDVAEALVATLGSLFTGPVNIGSGRPIAVRELVMRIARRIDAGQIELGALVSPDECIPMVAADTTRLHRLVGWRPGFTLDDALDRTIAWWREAMSESKPAVAKRAA